MMGSKERHFAPLIHVSLEELVPPDHFYRHLERTLDLSFVREFVQQTYAHAGRPSIDPVVFFKLQLVMFFEGIRSERQLMRHAADRLSVRWYIGYDLGEPLPDHSSLTRIRERYGVEVFHRFFDAIVEQCQQEKLVWGKELYVDGTQVNANTNLDSLTPRFAVETREAIQTHLAALFSDEDSKPEPHKAATEVIAAPLEVNATEGVTCPVPTRLPSVLSEAEREELGAENASRHDWLAEEGKPQRDVRGYYQRTSDLRISTTLVLFWNPGCGFCQRMLEDLKAWEASPPQGAPKLLVVSTGTVEANAAMGLRSPVLLGEGFSAGSKFGAGGTPMAVLVDAEGKIASEVAAGAQAVLGLAGHKQDATAST